MNIRPHHLICLHFFKGFGYNDDFVAKMAKVKQIYQQNDNQIVHGADELCLSCPHLINGECDNQITTVFDKAVEDILPIIDKYSINYLIQSKKWQSICHDCEWYQICTEQLTITKQLIEKLKLPFDISEAEYSQSIIKFVSPEGKLIRWPKKMKDKVYSIIFASKLLTELEYTEKEINEVLKGYYYDDYVLIRRSLVDYGFLNRENNCSKYYNNN